MASCPPITAHLGAGAGNVVSEGGEVLHDEVVSVVLGLVAQPPQNLPDKCQSKADSKLSTVSPLVLFVQPADPLDAAAPVLEDAGALVLVRHLAHQPLVLQLRHQAHVDGGEQHHEGAGQLRRQQVQTYTAGLMQTCRR